MDITIVNELELISLIHGVPDCKFVVGVNTNHPLFNNTLDHTSLTPTINRATTIDKLYIRSERGQEKSLEFNTVQKFKDEYLDLDTASIKSNWVKVSTNGVDYQRVTVDPETAGIVVAIEFVNIGIYDIVVSNYEGVVYHRQEHKARYIPVFTDTDKLNVLQLSKLRSLVDTSIDYGYICNTQTVHLFGQKCKEVLESSSVGKYKDKHQELFEDNLRQIVELAKTAKDSNFSEVAIHLAKCIDTCMYYLILGASEQLTIRRNNSLAVRREHKQH